MSAYLDNSATTRPSETVLEEYLRLSRAFYANPSSLHSLGHEAERVIHAAKETALRAIGAREGKFLFTSGGTESNNLAVLGSMSDAAKRGVRVICSAIEHPSVAEPFARLGELGAEFLRVGVDEKGVVRPELLEPLLTNETGLVSVMMVNNETGALQPIRELVQLVRARCPKALFHVDAVQALGKVPFPADRLGADLYSFSAHKLHGPKGVGGLYMKKGCRLKPILFGGGQEENLRSGTQNVPGIGAFALAMKEAVSSFDETPVHLRSLRDRLLNHLRKIPDVVILGGQHGTESAPHILNISFLGLRAEVLIHALEKRGVYVSAGSACSSNKPSLSSTLLAMGVERPVIEGALRLSLSRHNTQEEIEEAAKVIAEEVNILRKCLK